ncbi:MAG: hypothetical protein ACYTFI_21065 [Planctomycetota bacterium]|jgi:hypothetical protein
MNRVALAIALALGTSLPSCDRRPPKMASLDMVMPVDLKPVTDEQARFLEKLDSLEAGETRASVIRILGEPRARPEKPRRPWLPIYMETHDPRDDLYYFLCEDPVKGGYYLEALVRFDRRGGVSVEVRDGRESRAPPGEDQPGETE